MAKATKPTIPTAETADRALTREQAAAMTGYSAKTLANLAVLDQGPPLRKYRHKCFYIQSELMAWLRSLPVVAGAQQATK